MFKIVFGCICLTASLAVILIPIIFQRKEDNDIEYNREKFERIFAKRIYK